MTETRLWDTARHTERSLHLRSWLAQSEDWGAHKRWADSAREDCQLCSPRPKEMRMAKVEVRFELLQA